MRREASGTKHAESEALLPVRGQSSSSAQLLRRNSQPASGEHLRHKTSAVSRKWEALQSRFAGTNRCRPRNREVQICLIVNTQSCQERQQGGPRLLSDGIHRVQHPSERKLRPRFHISDETSSHKSQSIAMT